jgi:hypothetical protein
MLSSVGRALTGPTARNVARFGAGGTAGYLANDAYLNQVNPEVSDLGRMRSNLFSGVLGGALTSRGAMPALARAAKARDPKLLLGGLGVAARYGAILPDMEHSPIGSGEAHNRIGLGFGKLLDPGHSPLPKVVAHIKDQKKLEETLNTWSRPVEHGAEIATDKAYDKIKADLEKNKGSAAKWLQTAGLPATYGSLITALGGTPGEKPTLSDVGMAAVPHVAGGAGGAYLGHLLGGGVGNFLFKDNPKAEYEERRRQEQRRWWLQFLGSNLGAVGGVYGAMNAAPHLNKLIGSAMQTKQSEVKEAVGPIPPQTSGLLMRSLSNMLRTGTRAGLQRGGQMALGLGKDMALAGGMTAGQYAANIVPPGGYDAQGKPLGPNTDLSYMGSLYGTNLLGARLARGMLSGQAFAGKANPLTRGLTLGAMATAAPSVVNLGTSVPPLFGQVLNPEKINKYTAALDQDTGRFGQDPAGAAQAAARGAQKALANKPVVADAANLTQDVVEEAGVPGMSAKGNQSIKDMLGSTGLSMLAQGAGMATGGVAGLTAGDWLVDKLLTTAVNKKWLKKRKGLHQFLRDLGAVAGAGLGAYGGLKALNYGVPAAANYYNKHLATQPKTASVTPDWEKISFELGGLDVRLPDDVNAARMTAIAALVSGALGAGRGAYDPGYDEKTNRRGHIISKTRRSRLRGAGLGGLIGLTTGVGGSYTSQFANQYRPEIDGYIQSWLPKSVTEPQPQVAGEEMLPHENVDVVQPLLDTISHTA